MSEVASYGRQCRIRDHTIHDPELLKWRTYRVGTCIRALVEIAHGEILLHVAVDERRVVYGRAIVDPQVLELVRVQQQ